jgi:hypothetical protein
VRCRPVCAPSWRHKVRRSRRCSSGRSTRAWRVT